MIRSQILKQLGWPDDLIIMANKLSNEIQSLSNISIEGEISIQSKFFIEESVTIDLSSQFDTSSWPEF